MSCSFIINTELSKSTCHTNKVTDLDYYFLRKTVSFCTATGQNTHFCYNRINTTKISTGEFVLFDCFYADFEFAVDKLRLRTLKCEFVDVSGRSERGLHGRFDPPVWRGGVFPCEVYPPLTLEQFSSILPLLVGGEQCKGTQAVGI